MILLNKIITLTNGKLTVNSKIRRVVNFTENTTLAHKGQQLV